MTTFAGLDLSVRETAVCVVDQSGKAVADRKVATEPEDIIGLLRSIAGEYGRMLGRWAILVELPGGARVLVRADAPADLVATTLRALR